MCGLSVFTENSLVKKLYFTKQKHNSINFFTIFNRQVPEEYDYLYYRHASEHFMDMPRTAYAFLRYGILTHK